MCKDGVEAGQKGNCACVSGRTGGCAVSLGFASYLCLALHHTCAASAKCYYSDSCPPPMLLAVVPQLQERKGWDILLRAFLREFEPTEHAELHIVTHAFGEKVML